MAANYSAIWDMVKSEAEEFGASFEGDKAEFEAFLREQATQLAAVSAEVGPDHPSFRRALKSSRNRVILKAIGRSIDKADDFDQRVKGLVSGILMALAAV